MRFRKLTNRRAFLKLATIGAASAVLVACAPAAAPTPAPAKPTEAPKPAATTAPATAASPTAAAKPTEAPKPAAVATPTAAPAAAGKKVKISISHIGGGSLEASEKSDRMKQLRAAFPDVEIENRWFSYSAYVEKISLMTATGDLADLQFCNAFNDVPLMMENNLLTETGPILEKEGKNILAATPKEAWDSTNYDGKQYAVAHNTYDLNVWLTVYRKDWLDKLGMKVPETLDQMAEYWKAATFKDPDGDGKADTFGRCLAAAIRFDDDLFHAFDAAVGHHFNGFWRDRSGKLELDWVQPGMKEAWAWLRERWAEKVIDPDSITAQLTYRGQRWQSGMMGSSYSAWTSMDVDILEIRKTAPKAELIGGPALKGPNGHQGYTGEGFPWVYVTPKKNQNPEVAVRMVDWFFEPKNAARFVCDGEMGITLKPMTPQGWCAEYTPDERKAMGQEWNDKSQAAKDIVVYNGVWMPIAPNSLRPWLLNTMPADMKAYFEKVLKDRHSPPALQAYEYASKYMKLSAKKRPTKSEKQYWPGLQSRFAELMTQVVGGTVGVEQGWKEWLGFFEKNGGPTLTKEVNEAR